MTTPPPSIYCYRSVKDWEYDMALWCLENEPQDTSIQYGVEYLDGHIRRWKWFYTEATRADWMEMYPQFQVLRLETQGRINVPPVNNPGKPSAPDHLDGGSRADYRMAGYNRY